MGQIWLTGFVNKGFFFFLKKCFKKFYLFLTVLGPCCSTGFPPVVVSGGCSLVAGLQTFVAVTSLVVGHAGFSHCGIWAQ